MPLRCRPLAVALVLALGLAPAGARADDRGVETLDALFSSARPAPTLFSSDFLAKVPASDVAAFIGSFEARLGVPTAIQPAGSLYLITSPKGSIKASIGFDDRGRIASLLFQDELSAQNLEALTRVLSADVVVRDWFHPSYLKDVPLHKTDSMLTDMHKALGSFVRVDTIDASYVAVFEHGETHAQISTDSTDRIDYLAFTKPAIPLPELGVPSSPAPTSSP